MRDLTEEDVTRNTVRAAGLAGIALLSLASSCDREAADEAPAAAAAAVDTPFVVSQPDAAAQPEEIYFDLTAYAWYREGRPLMHDGRAYMPQADPAPVDVGLEEAGNYEGVRYYVAEDAREPVYTLYVPVYYRYWQRFTSPPGS
jgi:hypothetical protein